MPAVLRIALVCVVVVAAIYDFRFRRIPNWVTLSGMVLGFGCNTLLFGWHGLTAATLGLLLAMAVYMPLYLIRGMGAGDVKLMAAVGAITGPKNWLQIFLATALLGGVLSLALIANKRRFRQTLGNVALITTELAQFRSPAEADSRLNYRHKDAVGLPHGVSIAGGCLVFLLLKGLRWP